MPKDEVNKPICVEPDTCVMAKGKQELFFDLNKEGIAAVFYASVPGYSNASGHRMVVHIQDKESITKLLQQAATELYGETFKVTICKPTQENIDDKASDLAQHTERLCAEFFPQQIIKGEVIDCGKLSSMGKVENYQSPVTEKNIFSFSTLRKYLPI